MTTRRRHHDNPLFVDLDAPDDDYEEPRRRASRTKRKLEVEALQALGVRLVELPADRLAKVEMPDGLRDALREAQRITDFEGRRRQLQYIGRLMRDADPEPLQAAIDAFDGVSAVENAKLHRLERLLSEILENERALEDVLAAHPGADIQYLRQLRRNALKERELNKPPKAFRTLFQVLKELEAAASVPPAEEAQDDLDAPL